MSEPYTYYARDHKSWGNNIQVLNWPSGKIVGWLKRTPRIGDRIVFDLKSGESATVVITAVEAMRDPADMFFATVEQPPAPTAGATGGDDR